MDQQWPIYTWDAGILVSKTIRYQLKQKGIYHDWQEIVRIGNTQKIVTTTGKNQEDETIFIRRCSEPNEKIQTI